MYTAFPSGLGIWCLTLGSLFSAARIEKLPFERIANTTATRRARKRRPVSCYRNELIQIYATINVHFVEHPHDILSAHIAGGAGRERAAA